MNFLQILNDYLFFFLLWELVWKGLALWKSARKNETAWFIAILAVNSIGLLPIFYLIYDKYLREHAEKLLNKILKK